MGAAFYDAAGVEDADHVTVADSGKAMGDDKGSSALHEPVHSVLDDTLGTGIYG